MPQPWLELDVVMQLVSSGASSSIDGIFVQHSSRCACCQRACAILSSQAGGSTRRAGLIGLLQHAHYCRGQLSPVRLHTQALPGVQGMPLMPTAGTAHLVQTVSLST